jgi:hypothetical protein
MPRLELHRRVAETLVSETVDNTRMDSTVSRSRFGLFHEDAGTDSAEDEPSQPLGDDTPRPVNAERAGERIEPLFVHGSLLPAEDERATTRMML